ncbi:hypothetical protein ACFVAJ_18840 [Agromyces sp. NPDC057679]|uniref:hypothetical protein n=1 Tax=Agromyces sp. NPDC057679 TaxID=3346207 RepID=UPI00366C285A
MTTQSRADGRTPDRHGNVNRPGTFGTKQVSRADVKLADTIDLEVGDDMQIGPVAADTPLQVVLVTKSHNSWVLEAQQMVDLAWFAPDGTREEAAWVEKRRAAILKFIENEYGVEGASNDENTVVDFTATLNDKSGTMTEDRVYQRLWDETELVRLWNEMDDGTAGSENLTRKMQEHLDRQVFSDAWGAEVGNVTDEQVAATLNGLRDGELIDDLTAAAIAKRAHGLRLSWMVGELAELPATGYADRYAFRGSIERVQQHPDRHGALEAEIAALKAWANAR